MLRVHALPNKVCQFQMWPNFGNHFYRCILHIIIIIIKLIMCPPSQKSLAKGERFIRSEGIK